MWRLLVQSVGCCLVLVAACLSVVLAQDAPVPSRPIEDRLPAVSGRVTNGTPGGAVPDDLEVALHIFSGTKERAVYTTTLDADGTFDFSEQVGFSEDAVFQEDHRLVARVVYEGISYLSDFLTVDADLNRVTVPVTIYETTDSAGDISVAQLHVFVAQVGERIEIAQYCVIANNGLRTYVGPPRPPSDQSIAWSVTLPETVESLWSEAGGSEGDLVALDGALAHTGAIAPGAMGAQVSFGYELAQWEGLRVEQAFDIAVDAVIFVLPGAGLQLEGAGLSPAGVLETERGPAASYVAGPLEPLEPLAFTIAQVEATVAATSNQTGQVFLGLAMLAAAGIAAYRLWRAPSAGPVPATVLARVEAIAALDREFERGAVDEEAYRERRRRLKREVYVQLLDFGR